MAEIARQDGAAIEVRGLTKSYGGVHAVQGIDLLVGRGQIFALLGPGPGSATVWPTAPCRQPTSPRRPDRTG